MIALYILYALAVRGFLFEIKFCPLRKWTARKNKVFFTFMNCAFCNGYIVGWITLVIIHMMKPVDDFYLTLLFFPFAVGYLSYMQRLYSSQWDYSE